MATQTQAPPSSSAQETFPGDDLVPDAVMVYDQKRKIKAPAEEIFPWLLQLGKGRGGWYLPAKVENFLPKNARAAGKIDEKWQNLSAGDKIPDYGFSKHDYFIVKQVEAPHAIVLASQRGGCAYTWALLLHEMQGDSSDPEPATMVHLRFRGRIEATGAKQKVIVKGGELLDRLSTTPMLAGLAERCEKAHAQ